MPVDDNPFQPPPSGDGARAPRESHLDLAALPPVRPLAVLIGAVVDNAATWAFAILYQIVMVMRVGEAGFEHEIERTLHTLPHMLTLYVAGGAMSVLGGLVAGTIARRNALGHGLAAGVLSAMIGKMVDSMLRDPGAAASITSAEVWMSVLATPLTIASAGLGGYLAARRLRLLDTRA